jgi:hypothetical protein
LGKISMERLFLNVENRWTVYGEFHFVYNPNTQGFSLNWLIDKWLVREISLFVLLRRLKILLLESLSNFTNQYKCYLIVV